MYANNKAVDSHGNGVAVSTFNHLVIHSHGHEKQVNLHPSQKQKE